jgi:hypothetical protein
MKIHYQQYAQTDMTQAHYHNQKRSAFLYLMLLLITAFFSAPTITYAEQIVLPKITVYKSPTCGCCTKWVKHLEKNGFIVEAFNSKNMPAVKRELGVEPHYQSCHTAMVGGYYVEGHVPADDIKRLLTEKPTAVGLAVPGMPMGSPGMEGNRKDAYSVILVDKEGAQKAYSKY